MTGRGFARVNAHARRRTARATVGLALAGGGPLGGIYEVGTLLALADSLNDPRPLHAGIAPRTTGSTKRDLEHVLAHLERQMTALRKSGSEP